MTRRRSSERLRWWGKCVEIAFLRLVGASNFLKHWSRKRSEKQPNTNLLHLEGCFSWPMARKVHERLTGSRWTLSSRGRSWRNCTAASASPSGFPGDRNIGFRTLLRISRRTSLEFPLGVPPKYIITWNRLIRFLSDIPLHRGVGWWRACGWFLVLLSTFFLPCAPSWCRCGPLDYASSFCVVFRRFSEILWVRWVRSWGLVRAATWKQSRKPKKRRTQEEDSPGSWDRRVDPPWYISGRKPRGRGSQFSPGKAHNVTFSILSWYLWDEKQWKTDDRDNDPNDNVCGDSWLTFIDESICLDREFQCAVTEHGNNNCSCECDCNGTSVHPRFQSECLTCMEHGVQVDVEESVPSERLRP